VAGEKPRLRERLRDSLNRHALTPGLRKFTIRLAAKMLASAFLSFTIPFVTVGAVGLVIQLIPWLFRPGVTDIDPLPILLFAFLFGFGSMYLRYRIMKKFSDIRP
jgi:hypothetical protein